MAIAIHGGFWKAPYLLDQLPPLCRALAKAGVAAWNVEYRRVGNPGGGWPGTLQDVAAAADFLRTLAPVHELDLTRVVSLGHSAGGHLAVWLAARGRLPKGDALFVGEPLKLAAAVSYAGVLDLRDAHARRLGGGAVEAFLGGSPDAQPGRCRSASPCESLPLGVPQVLVHGALDDIVPLAMSESYARTAKEAGDAVRLVVLPDVGHFEGIDPATAAGARLVAIVVEAATPSGAGARGG